MYVHSNTYVYAINNNLSCRKGQKDYAPMVEQEQNDLTHKKFFNLLRIGPGFTLRMDYHLCSFQV